MLANNHEFRSFYFDPLTSHDDKYDNNLDVDDFYA